MIEHAAEAKTIGERITEALSFKTVFTIDIGSVSIPITETVVTTWIVMAILILIAVLGARKLKEVPTGFQTLLEGFVGFFNNFVKEQIGHHWRPYAPYLGTVAVFLVLANMIALISPHAGFGFEPPFALTPPTRDINVTAAMALMTILLVLFSSIRYRGFFGWLKSLVVPNPFNLLEYFIKPLSLCLRLFGNILGAYIIMEMIGMVVPLIAPPLFGMYFDFFDGLIQAVVFTYLSTLYIAEAVE
jgi:F-type H+-transporting ATPase subunit a